MSDKKDNNTGQSISLINTSIKSAIEYNAYKAGLTPAASPATPVEPFNEISKKNIEKGLEIIRGEGQEKYIGNSAEVTGYLKPERDTLARIQVDVIHGRTPEQNYLTVKNQLSAKQTGVALVNYAESKHIDLNKFLTELSTQKLEQGLKTKDQEKIDKKKQQFERYVPEEFRDSIRKKLNLGEAEVKQPDAAIAAANVAGKSPYLS